MAINWICITLFMHSSSRCLPFRLPLACTDEYGVVACCELALSSAPLTAGNKEILKRLVS